MEDSKREYVRMEQEQWDGLEEMMALPTVGDIYIPKLEVKEEVVEEPTARRGTRPWWGSGGCGQPRCHAARPHCSQCRRAHGHQPRQPSRGHQPRPTLHWQSQAPPRPSLATIGGRASPPLVATAYVDLTMDDDEEDAAIEDDHDDGGHDFCGLFKFTVIYIILIILQCPFCLNLSPSRTNLLKCGGWLDVLTGGRSQMDTSVHFANTNQQNGRPLAATFWSGLNWGHFRLNGAHIFG